VLRAVLAPRPGRRPRTPRGAGAGVDQGENVAGSGAGWVLLADGASDEQILAAYPQLTEANVAAVRADPAVAG